MSLGRVEQGNLHFAVRFLLVVPPQEPQDGMPSFHLPPVQTDVLRQRVNVGIQSLRIVLKTIVPFPHLQQHFLRHILHFVRVL